MASKPPVANDPVGPVAPPPANKREVSAEYKYSDAEALQMALNMRGKLSRKEFARLISGLPRVAKILGPYGLHGCYVEDEKTLAEFQTALAKWATANGRPDMAMATFGPVAPVQRHATMGPTDPNMLRRCRDDPESCMGPKERYELFQRRMNNMKANPIGTVMAAGGEAIAYGMTQAGIPMGFDSDKFIENSAPLTGILTGIGSAGLQRENMNSTVRTAQPPQKTPPAISRPATQAPAAPQAAKPAAPTSNVPPEKSPNPNPVPVSSPTNNPDFSSVGKGVGTEAPGTVPVATRRNSYPNFEKVRPDNQPTAQAQTDKLSGQLKEPIPANRVLVAPWVGRMRNAQGDMMSSGTSEGWLRSESRFWSEFKRQFPSDFALIGPNRTVTPQLAQRWGWSNRTVGQKLIHHHIDNGNLVVAVPEGLHQGSSGNIHATVKVEGLP